MAALIAAIHSLIAVEVARPVADDGELDQGRDILCMVLLCLGFAFIYSRPNLHSAQKKLGGAIAGLATGSVSYHGFAKTDLYSTAFPFKFIFPTAVACGIAVVVMLLPLPGLIMRPRLALTELKARLKYHAQLVQAVLDTNSYLGLTSDMRALHKLDELLDALEKNAASFKMLYMFSCVEICLGCPWAWARFFRRQRSAMARLGAQVKMCGDVVPPIQTIVASVRPTVHDGQVTDSRVAYHTVAMESLKEATDAFCQSLDLSVDVALTTNLDVSAQREAKLATAKERLDKALAQWKKDDQMGHANAAEVAQRISQGAGLSGARADEMEYIRRLTGPAGMTALFAQQPPDFAKVEGSAAKRAAFNPKDLFKWFKVFFTALPTGQLRKDAIKNTVGVTMVACFVFLHAMRFKDPEHHGRVYIHESVPRRARCHPRSPIGTLAACYPCAPQPFRCMQGCACTPFDTCPPALACTYLLCPAASLGHCYGIIRHRGGWELASRLHPACEGYVVRCYLGNTDIELRLDWIRGRQLRDRSDRLLA